MSVQEELDDARDAMTQLAKEIRILAREVEVLADMVYSLTLDISEETEEDFFGHE